MKRLDPLWLTALLGVGCAHNQAAVSAAAAPPVQTPPAAVAQAPAPQANDDLDAMLRGNVLHFDFDKANLTAESRERLQRIADIMHKQPALMIRIEGNCDERGGEEFNLQLGQERAKAAKTYLINLGIAPAMIATISYGKDKPENPAHSEEAWSENRRDDIRNVASR
jgi:peptidoglycan-associated lipoprotein